MHNNRDKDRGHLGHTITHTDTAQGKGGGRMTENAAPTAVEENDADDTSPTNRQADVGSDNAKNTDIPSASQLFEEERPKGPSGG